MMRMLPATLAIGMVAGFVLCACGDGYDTEEAEATCDTIKQADANNYNCMSQADYDACVTCHEDCGDACLVVDTACPPSFSCGE